MLPRKSAEGCCQPDRSDSVSPAGSMGRAPSASVWRTGEGVVAVHPALMAEIKFYGRHKAGSIRDSVLLDLIDSRAEARMPSEPEWWLWDCDSDAAVAAMSTRLPEARSDNLPVGISAATGMRKNSASWNRRTLAEYRNDEPSAGQVQSRAAGVSGSEARDAMG
jgi:hypothetical protein